VNDKTGRHRTAAGWRWIGLRYFFEREQVEGLGMLGTNDGRFRKRDAGLLLTILLLAIMVRTLASAMLPTPLESDYLGYWQIANNLHSGLGLVGADGTPTAFLSPGYPIFLGQVFEVLGPTIATVKAANIFLGATSVAFLYASALRLFGSRLVAALAAMIFATYSESIVYTAYVAKENLMIFLICTQLFFVVTARPHDSWRFANAVLFGMATGCLAVVGNAALALLPGFAFYVLCKDGQIIVTCKYFFIAFVFAMLAMWPMLEHNHQAFGHYVLNNNGGYNLYIGNNPNATPFFESIADTPLGPQWQILHQELGEYGVDQLLRKKAIDYITENPTKTLILAARKALAFWTPPIHEGKYSSSAGEKIVRVVWLGQFLLICLMFLVASSRFRTYPDQIITLWLLVGGYTAVHMMFYVIYRYRLPIFPVLSLGAGLGVEVVLTTLCPRWILAISNFFGTTQKSL